MGLLDLRTLTQDALQWQELQPSSVLSETQNTQNRGGSSSTVSAAQRMVAGNIHRGSEKDEKLGLGVGASDDLLGI